MDSGTILALLKLEEMNSSLFVHWGMLVCAFNGGVVCVGNGEVCTGRRDRLLTVVMTAPSLNRCEAMYFLLLTFA